MVLERLAEEYQQLYLKPEPGMSESEEYRQIMRKGKEAAVKNLDHFKGSSEDSLIWENTPEGDVRILTLGERADFETFLQIMLYRCEPTKISPDIGAMTISGITNWGKINKHKEEFLKKHFIFQWNEELKTFTSKEENYKDTLILLSRGPYSGLSGEQAGIPDGEWIEKSQLIRMYHECTHVICHRRYPDQTEAVRDEIVADCIGMLAVFGSYDATLAGKFLGISSEGYVGGRLINYLTKKEREEKNLQRIAAEVYLGLKETENAVKHSKWKSPYEMIDVLMAGTCLYRKNFV